MTAVVARAVPAALVAATFACAGSPTTLDPDTGVVVAVVRGPIVPVEREGEENVAPVDGAVVSIVAVSGREVARIETGAGGEGRTPVPPGTYRALVVLCPGAMSLPGPEPVAVVAGEFARVRLECDTGIR